MSLLSLGCTLRYLHLQLFASAPQSACAQSRWVSSPTLGRDEPGEAGGKEGLLIGQHRGQSEGRTRGMKVGTAGELSGSGVRRAFLMELVRDKARAGMGGASELRVARQGLKATCTWQPRGVCSSR